MISLSLRSSKCKLGCPAQNQHLAYIRNLIPAFKDPRYMRINGKPLFLICRTELFPERAKTAALWQEEAIEAGLPGRYLARVENFVKDVDPNCIGFDAAVEFAAGPFKGGDILFRGRIATLLGKLHLLPKFLRDNGVHSYPATVHGLLTKPEPSYRWFGCVSPMLDNSARRSVNANIFTGSTPALFKQWLGKIANRTRQCFDGDERIVFINAWNEWAEGCHLEPDQKWGHVYLEATRNTLTAAPNTDPPPPLRPPPVSQISSGKFTGAHPDRCPARAQLLEPCYGI